MKYSSALNMLGCALVAWSASGCAVTLAPQAARAIATGTMMQQGAMNDSSQAYKVAFFANPGQQPERIKVNLGLGGTDVLASQWATHLALTLNRVVGRVQRYDEDFAESAHAVFASETVQGDVRYSWRAQGQVQHGSARVATLRLTAVEAAANTDGITARGTLEVTVGDFVHLYATEVVAQTDWMNALMERLGAQVLGDPSFWKAVEAAPKPVGGVLAP